MQACNAVAPCQAHLLRDGVCAVKLEHDVLVKHVLHAEDGVLGVLLRQAHRGHGAERHAKGSKLAAEAGGRRAGWVGVAAKAS